MEIVASPMRHVEVARLSMREELAHIVRLGTSILLCVWLYLAYAASLDTTSRRNLLPYQALVQNQSSVEQRTFRELQEGLLEAEGARSATGTWLTPSALAANGIPPFADDPTAKAARYEWALVRDGTFINYVGVPDRPNVPAWLLLVQEPEPGIPPDQLFEDEEHHKLLDGSMLHVSTWKHAQGLAKTGTVIRVPQAEGWTQLYAVGPAATK